MGHSRTLFINYRLINTVDSTWFFKCAEYWIRTPDLWCQKRSLYQLSHNHWPFIFQFFLSKLWVRTSVATFGEILPLRQNLKSFGQILCYYWAFVTIVYLIWQIFYTFGQSFIVLKSQKLKNNIAIRSHWYLLLDQCVLLNKIIFVAQLLQCSKLENEENETKHNND